MPNLVDQITRIIEIVTPQNPKDITIGQIRTHFSRACFEEREVRGYKPHKHKPQDNKPHVFLHKTTEVFGEDDPLTPCFKPKTHTTNGPHGYALTHEGKIPLLKSLRAALEYERGIDPLEGSELKGGVNRDWKESIPKTPSRRT